MKKETNLCMGCMIEKNIDSTCSYCGYTDNSTYLASYLAPKTFLSGRYIVGKLLSYNGEGALYLAFDTEKQAKVTIKEYMPDTLCTRKKDTEIICVNIECVPLYKTYLSEFAELNKSIMNADETLRIQKVLDVFLENNTVYAVFEYIVGISLKSYLSNLGGSLSWEQVREFFPPLLTTLNIIHSHGILHRGISPSTIIVNERSELYLISFGITASRTYGSELNFEVFSGYAPPELYNTATRQGSWTDIYGISAVLYKVLTGQMPVSATDRQENDVLIEPSLINRNIPHNVSKVIMDGLAINQEERLENMNVFINRLFETPPVMLSIEHTAETVIKKPVSMPNNGYSIKPAITQANRVRSLNKRRKNKSNTTAIVLCATLGLLIIGFIIAIILPTINPDIYNSFVNTDDGDDGDDTDINTGEGTTIVTVPFVSTAVTESTISNEPLYKVPNFTNPPRQYEIIEKSPNYNFLKIIPEYEFNSEFKEGYIFEQDVNPDSEVVFGTELNVKVSKGAEFVKLPDFTGVSFDDYKKILSSLNIKYQSEKENSNFKKDEVIRCDKNVGEDINIAEGQTVTIYYSTGIPPTTSGTAE